MNKLSNISTLIGSKLGEKTFQVWLYNENKNTTTFICGEKDVGLAPRFYTDTNHLPIPSKTSEQTENGTLIYFFYESDYQVAIFIYGKNSSLLEKDQDTLFYLLNNYILEEVIQSKNKELDIMTDSIRSITSSLQSEEVLESILRKALQLIAPFDAGYVLLYDAEKDRLKVKVSVGFEEDMQHFEPKVGEGITGVVFQDGKGRLYNTSKQIHEQMVSFHMSEENLAAIYGSVKQPMESLICVPISIQETRIGVITIHQRTLNYRLTEHDLSLLAGFADQAGIAIQNAQYHTEAMERLEEMTVLSKELEEKNAILRKRYDVRERLMAVSLKNEGIQTLLSTLSNILKRHILFFNYLELYFYDQSWHKEELTFSVFELKMIFTNYSRPVNVMLSDSEGKQSEYYLYPIYNGQLFLGCMILNVDNAVSHSDRITLQQGSAAIALELTRKESDLKNHQQRMYAEFQHLMELDSEADIREAGEALGLENDSYWIAAVLEIPKPLFESRNVNFQIHQLTAQMEMHLTYVTKHYYISYNKITMLIPLAHPKEGEEVFHKLRELKQIIGREEGPVFRGGISDVYRGLGNLPKCAEEANKSIAYLINRDLTDVIKYRDIGISRLFLNQSSKEIKKFVDEVFTPLDPTNERHLELKQTVLVYIKWNRSATQAAKELHIHKNTLYQRLRSIEELLDIDLDNNDDYLELHLAYHLDAQMKLP